MRIMLRLLTTLLLLCTTFAGLAQIDTSKKANAVGAADPLRSDKPVVPDQKAAAAATPTEKALILYRDTAISDKTNICSACIPVPQALTSHHWWLVFSPAIVFLVLLIFICILLRKFNMDDALSENDYPKITVQNPQYGTRNFDILTKSLHPLDMQGVFPATVDISDHPGAMNTTINAADTATYATQAATAAAAAGQTAAAAAATQAATAAALIAQQASGASTGLVPPRASISRYIALVTTLLILVITVCLSCFFIYHYIHTSCPPDLSNMTTILLALGLGILPYAVNKVSGAFNKEKTR